MRIAAGALVCVLFVLALVRAALYVEFVVYQISTPYDAHYLESAMVHFGWRVQHGVQLYPEWKYYPHVANFYAPLNFVIVGLLGRAAGADLGGLYFIGRVVTVTSSLVDFLGPRPCREPALRQVRRVAGSGA